MDWVFCAWGDNYVIAVVFSYYISAIVGFFFILFFGWDLFFEDPCVGFCVSLYFGSWLLSGFARGRVGVRVFGADVDENFRVDVSGVRGTFAVLRVGDYATGGVRW